MRFLLITILLLSYFVGYSCSCFSPNHFDIKYFDDSKNIYSIRIDSLSTVKDDSDTSDLDLIYLDLFKIYHVTILNVYKGDISINKKTFAFETNSSCSWQPRIGEDYIFYTNDNSAPNPCNRIVSGKQEYRDEIMLLERLVKKDKDFYAKDKFGTYLKGQFKSNKRHGKWQIYSQRYPNEIVYELFYNNGVLISIDKTKFFPEHSFWYDRSYEYYSNLIGVTNY